MARVAIIGAGSMEFTQQVVSDLMRHPESQGMDFHLVDIDEGRLATSEAMVKRIVEEAGGRGLVQAFSERREALRDVRYCVNTIQVGGIAATKVDFSIPERFGIKQTIADTLGIGGIFRGLRTIPAVLNIAQDLVEQSPGAVFLNYTNPMSMVMMALSEAFPELSAYGLCHSVHYTAETVAGYLDIPFEELRWKSAGINHMAWMLKLQHREIDCYPKLHQLSVDPRTWEKDPVRFELLKRLGFFATESSEHNAEYSSHFLPFPEEIERLSIPVGEYLRRSMAHLDKYSEIQRKLHDPNARFTLKPSPEYAPAFIHAMESQSTWWFQGNVSNRDNLISNLPDQAAVEVPCLVNQHGCFPTTVGALPEPLAAMNRIAINVQILTVQAALQKKRGLVYQAAMMDPLLSAQLPLPDIWRLVDALFEAHADYLKGYV